MNGDRVLVGGSERRDAAANRIWQVSGLPSHFAVELTRVLKGANTTSDLLLCYADALTEPDFAPPPCVAAACREAADVLRDAAPGYVRWSA